MSASNAAGPGGRPEGPGSWLGFWRNHRLPAALEGAARVVMWAKTLNAEEFEAASQRLGDLATQRALLTGAATSHELRQEMLDRISGQLLFTVCVLGPMGAAVALCEYPALAWAAGVCAAIPLVLGWTVVRLNSRHLRSTLARQRA